MTEATVLQTVMTQTVMTQANMIQKAGNEGTGQR